MATKAYPAGHYFVLLLVAVLAKASETECQSERSALQRVGEEPKECQPNCLLAVKATFSEEQNCPPCQSNIARVEKLIAEAEARMEAKMRAIVEAKLLSFSEAQARMQTTLQNIAADVSRLASSAGK